MRSDSYVQHLKKREATAEIFNETFPELDILSSECLNTGVKSVVYLSIELNKAGRIISLYQPRTDVLYLLSTTERQAVFVMSSC